MKTFMSALMTLTLWFSQVGIPVAYAAEEQQAAPEVNVGSRYTSDSNTKVSSEKKGEGGLFGYRSLTMTNLTLFATVAGSVAITLSCWNQTSSKIFVAATVLFATMEVLNWVSYKEASKRELAYYKNQDHDSQVKALEAAAKQTEEAAKAANTRAMLAKVAGAGMMAAGAMALYEGYRATAECAAANAAQPFSAAAAAKACTQAPFMASDYCAGSAFSFNDGYFPVPYYANMRNISDQIKTAKNDTSAFLIAKEMESFYNGGVQSPSYLEFEALSKNFKSENVNKEFSLKEMLVEFYENAGEMIISNAYAQDQIKTIIAAGGGGALAGYLAMSKTEEQAFKQFKNGYIRGAGFIAAGAMAVGAGVQIAGAAQKMNQRAAEYRKLATTMNSKFADSGELANRASQQRITSAPVGGVESVDTSKDGIACFTGGDGTLNLDASCSCRATNTCKVSEVPKVDHKTFSGAGLISNTAGLLGQTSNYLNKGQLSKAVTTAGKAGNMAARVNRLKKSLQDYINKKQVDSGNKPFDFAGMEKKAQQDMINGVNKAFNDMNDSQRSQLANFAPSLGTENGQTVAEAKPVEFKDEGPMTGRVGKGDSLASAGTPSSMDFKFDLDEKGEELPPIEDSMINGENVAGVSLDEYDTTSGGDIAPSHEDIFKLIHTRYLKSAYPRFFVQRKEEF